MAMPSRWGAEWGRTYVVEASDDYPLIKRDHLSPEEKKTTKILAMKIKSGALCKIITAYNEPEDARLLMNGTGEVGQPHVSAHVAIAERDNVFVKKKYVSIPTGQMVLFLRSFSNKESLVLAAKNYYILHDKNLEPVVNEDKTEGEFRKWLENFKRQARTEND